MSKSNKDRVFLSYAREDLETAENVYDGLKNRGLDVWFDQKHIGPGNWKPQIENAISKSKYFIICISESALRETDDENPGFQDQELNMYYSIAEKRSSNDFYIVPVRIEECGRRDTRLSSSPQYGLFDDFEMDLDKLAIHLGGYSLSDSTAKDERTKDQKTIDHLNGKAETYYYAVEYDKSIAISNSILAFAPDAENTTALNNLGAAWDSKGEYNMAIQYYKKALKSILRTFGEEHPTIAATLNNLGGALSSKGQYDKAIIFYKKALKSDLNIFGEHHPNVAIKWNNLGAAWDSKGEYDKAIEFYEKALKSDINTFGEHHPNVAIDRNNLGTAWKAKGEYDKAIEFYEKALKSGINTFGENHPNVATGLNNLGAAWYSKGKYDKAFEFYEKALMSNINTFGENHPDVAIDLNNLGSVWKAKGEYSKAIEYYEKALKSLKAAGPHHHAEKDEKDL